ncbi:MAG: methyltransferase domain-containing protein [Parcubacteria group bacterium]
MIDKHDRTIIEDPGVYYDHANRKKEWKTGDLSRMSKIVDEYISESSSSRLLEVGCGMAETLEHLSHDVRYYGLDPTPSCIVRGKERYPNHVFIEGVAEKVPFEDNFFDIVLSIQVIEMLHDPKTALEEMMRVIKPGGLFIALSPNFENPKSTISAVRHYTRWQKFVLVLKRIWDIIKRFLGVLTFRTIFQNIMQTGGRYEKGDDDLKYIVSAYEVTTLLKQNGFKEIYARRAGEGSTGIKKLIIKVLGLLPPFRYYGSGLFLVYKKV